MTDNLLRLYQQALPLYLFWGVAIFIIGCCMGSFLNVCIWRMPLGESVVTAPSHCPKCGHLIRWYENIPLLSFLALRARCSQCRQPITWRYFFVELLTGILFAIAYLRFTQTGDNLLMLIPAGTLIMLAVTTSFIDIEHRIIPDQTTYPAILIGITFHLFYQGWFFTLTHTLPAIAITAITLYLFSLLGRAIFKQEALGLGDVKFLTAIAAILSLPAAFFTMLFAAVAGSIYGILYGLVSHKPLAKLTIPFGPFLAISALLYLYLSPLLNQLLSR